MFESESDDDDSRFLPAVLRRPVVANHIMHESFTMDTRDHEDHTFCGIMFDVRCRGESSSGVPIETLQIESLSVRGDLGPLTVWTTPETFTGKEHNSKLWKLVYEREHPSSRHDYEVLQLEEAIRLSPGESCGLYVHSLLTGDDAIVYDNTRFDIRRQRMPCEDQMLSVLAGQAHLSNRPFSDEGMWWGTWRANREFVGRVGYGVSYALWNPVHKAHCRFPPEFQRALMTCLLCARRPECPLNRMQDEVVYYIFNMCKYDWFNTAPAPIDRGNGRIGPALVGMATGTPWNEDSDSDSVGLPVSSAFRFNQQHEVSYSDSSDDATM